jgi:KUP system potassium uptake protein
MVVWFTALTLSGLASIFTMPEILKAVSPHYGFIFLKDNGMSGFFVLSEVILCATGGEALYADMGHLGRRPIIRAWYFVFFALLLNYLGQGAFVLNHPKATNLLFGMIQDQCRFFYIPFVILTIAATVIASQALISGVFSIVYQGITTRIMPLMRVDYTSSKLKSQIYIGSVNWSLMVAVIFIMLIFKESGNLAAAYGLAVTGTMLITGIMMTVIFSHTAKKWKVPIALTVTLFNLAFLLSNLNKLPHGGYWSLILASIPLGAMLIWTRGQRALYLSMKPLDLETFLVSFQQIYAKNKNIPGTALFFTRQKEVVPPYVTHCIIRSNIIYERNIFISLLRTDEPFGLKTFSHTVDAGLESFEIKVGYMVVIDLEKLLKKNEINEKVIFYGIEDISTRNIIWKFFSTIKKQSPNFVQFHKLPAAKLQGVVTRVEM